MLLLPSVMCMMMPHNHFQQMQLERLVPHQNPSHGWEFTHNITHLVALATACQSNTQPKPTTILRIIVMRCWCCNSCRVNYVGQQYYVPPILLVQTR